LGRNLKQLLGSQLWRLADLTRAGATRREFRSRAYRQAVWSLDEISPTWKSRSRSCWPCPGIGGGVARLISEFRETGDIGELDRLLATLPQEAGRLRLLPRMTPNRLRWLKSEAGIETVQDLIDAIAHEQLGGLKGVGPETARTWLDRSESLLSSGLTPLAAHAWSDRLATHIQRHVAGAEIIVTGAVRRLDEWVNEIDMVVGEGPGVIRFLQPSAVVTGFEEFAEGSDSGLTEQR
jgi:DNA polymerase/3'-5' exonuclease PolX